jgi:hypothetical protein
VNNAVTAAVSTNPNRLDNGDMSIDQHNCGNSFSVGSGGGWIVDRWYAEATKSSKMTVGYNYGITPPTSNGFIGCIGMQSSSSFSLATTDFFAFDQGIEAAAIGDLNFGSASAQAVTLSFWVYSTLTGTFSGAIGNGPTTTRSYIFTYVISSASTWTKIVLTIPGDTTGTWINAGQSASIGLDFDLGSGSTYRSTAGSWLSGNFIGQTGSATPITTSGVRWGITGIKLEAGSVASPFIFDPMPVRVARCQRYFCKSYLWSTIPGTATYVGAHECQTPSAGTNGFYFPFHFPVTMRAAPTMTMYSPNSGNSGVISANPGGSNIDIGGGSLLVGDIGDNSFITGYNGGNSNYWFAFHYTASAEI